MNDLNIASNQYTNISEQHRIHNRIDATISAKVHRRASLVRKFALMLFLAMDCKSDFYQVIIE